MKPRAIHRHFARGQRVLVILRSGEQFVDKFVEAHRTYMQFAEKGKVANGDIRATVIPK